MLSPYPAIAALLAVIAALWIGFSTGKKVERQVWLAEKVELEEAHRADIANEMTKRHREQKFNEARARKASEDHEKALKEVASTYAADIAAVRRAGGLRIPARVCPSAPGTAAADQGAGTRGPDEAHAGTEQLPEGIESRLFALAQRADQLVEQCRALQTWVKDRGHYGEPDEHH